MTATDEPHTLYEGRVLRMVKRGLWEYVERKREIRAAFIAPLTADGKLIFIREFRIPLQKSVIGFPAGLIGDTVGRENELVEDAVKRELVEEAGFEAGRVTVWTAGPTSAGLTSEVISLVLAEDLRRVNSGGGLPGENIDTFEVPLGEVDGWIDAREAEGCLIDAKIFACLYLLHREMRRRNGV